jgi:replicative DNA helicase
MVNDNFQTLQSKANDMNWDDDEFTPKSKLKGFKPPMDDDGDAPF